MSLINNAGKEPRRRAPDRGRMSALATSGAAAPRLGELGGLGDLGGLGNHTGMSALATSGAAAPRPCPIAASRRRQDRG